MTSPYPERDIPEVDAGRLWAGGAATAVVAALVAVAGILIARGLLHVEIFAPKRAGVWGNATTPTYAVAAFLLALAATGLLHLLLTTTPQATQFFGWIMTLLAIVAAVVPFTVVRDQQQMIATALLNLLIGLAITLLLISMAGSAVRRPGREYADAPAYPREPGYPGDRGLPPTRAWRE